MTKAWLVCSCNTGGPRIFDRTLIRTLIMRSSTRPTYSVPAHNKLIEGQAFPAFGIGGGVAKGD